MTNLTTRFCARLDASDKKRLAYLSEHYRASSATVVRLLIKEKHDALAPAIAGKPARS